MTSAWSPLEGKRIFITGGTGFFGKSLLSSYLRFGVRANITLSGKRIEALEWNGEEYDYIIHMAAPGDARKVNDEATYATIVLGQMRILDFAARAGTKSVLFTSSGAVYGQDNAYARGKREAEKLGVEWSERTGQDFKIARCFSFVGPHLNLDSGHAIGSFIRGAREGLISVSNGRSVRSYLYADDLIEWLLTILVRGESCVPYDVGSNEAISVSDLARSIKRMVNPSCTIEDRTEEHTEPGTTYLPDLTAARGLGLKVTTGLDEAILKTIGVKV